MTNGCAPTKRKNQSTTLCNRSMATPWITKRSTTRPKRFYVLSADVIPQKADPLKLLSSGFSGIFQIKKLPDSSYSQDSISNQLKQGSCHTDCNEKRVRGRKLLARFFYTAWNDRTAISRFREILFIYSVSSLCKPHKSRLFAV